MPVRIMHYVFIFDEQYTHKFECKEMAYYEAFNSGRKTIQQQGITFTTN